MFFLGSLGGENRDAIIFDVFFTTSCMNLLLFLIPENHFLTAYYKYCMDYACMGLTRKLLKIQKKL